MRCGRSSTTTVFRRPWKSYQTDFFQEEEQRERTALAAERDKLDADAKYQELQKQLADAQKATSSGETAKQLAAAQQKLQDGQPEGARRRHPACASSRASSRRPGTSTTTPSSTGGNVDAARKRRDRLAEEKSKLEADWKATQQVVSKSQAEIDELRAPVVTVEKQMRELEEERERIANKLDGMKSMLGPIAVARIPSIKQIVLPDFDINNFEEPVARVDRCTSCHVGIDKAGFEDLPNPLKTHPKRDTLLVKHPPDKFGCTPCHEGQGVAVNTVAQAHGEVPFWEHPLLAR